MATQVKTTKKGGAKSKQIGAAMGKNIHVQSGSSKSDLAKSVKSTSGKPISAKLIKVGEQLRECMAEGCEYLFIPSVSWQKFHSPECGNRQRQRDLRTRLKALKAPKASRKSKSASKSVSKSIPKKSL